MTWLLIILLPLLLALPGRAALSRPGVLRWLLPLAAVPALWAGLGVPPLDGGAHLPGLLLGTSCGLDGMRRTVLLLAALLWGFSGWHAAGSLRGDAHPARFAVFFLLSMAGNFGLIIAEDVVLFYTSFVLMSLSAFGLVIHRQDGKARRAARIYLIMAMIGELALLASIYLAVREAGAVELARIAEAVADAPGRNAILLTAFVGFGIKAGAVPLYFWLPLAHPAAPPPASAVLSGSMIKAGLIGLTHFFPVGLADLPGWGVVFIALGCVAGFGAVWIGLYQTDPKTALAYSSISQMGWMTVLLGIGVATPEAWPALAPGLAFFIWHHGLAKGALFLGSGLAVGGAAGRLWITGGLVLAALVLAGAPLTSGAAAKYALKEGAAWAPGVWHGLLPWLIPLSSLATALLMGRFLMLCDGKMVAGGQSSEFRGRKRAGGRCAGGGMVLSWGVLVVLAVVGWRVPGLLAGGAEVSGGGRGIVALAEVAWPLVAAGVVLVVWRRVAGAVDPGAAPRVPPGDAVVWIERGWSVFFGWWNRRGLPNPTRWALNLVPLSDRLLDTMEERSVIDRSERRIGTWRAVGIFFLLLVLLFFVSFV